MIQTDRKFLPRIGPQKSASPQKIMQAGPTSPLPPNRPKTKPGIISNRHPFKPPKRWQDLESKGFFNPSFYINKLTPMSAIDPLTKRWIRNASDERAAQEGARFREGKGQFVVDWVGRYCHLYEGDKGGQLMDIDDWQYEYFMSLFGWYMLNTELGRWLRRFKTASVWIPKKNAKSPTLAATGLYMLIGEGELGQKCYSVARDGGQAMIAHRHAIEMVLSSPLLRAECKINATTGTITHIPSRSEFKIVKGDNSMSTEGFNGSLFVDEVHVVIQALMDRITRAGISRLQPIHVEMSTSGDNADGYGSGRYDYSLAVQRCIPSENGAALYNPRHYVLDFSIDQNTKIEDLYDRKLVEKLAIRVNPTAGRIIRFQSELMDDDYAKSVHSLTELRKFAMYRLNLWTAAGAGWIEPQDWLNCGKHYTLEQLRDFPCLGGLDLSKTRDMTAFTLMFAVPNKHLGIVPYTWTWLWLPKNTARRYKNKVDFEQMCPNSMYPQYPYLTLMHGKAINYKSLATHLDWAKTNFDMRGLGYDPYNSDEICRILDSEYGWGEDEMIAIKQSMQYMGPPTRELERLILRNEIRHPNNPVMGWQFRHAVVDNDSRGNIMVVKPEQDDYRKVDGIVSLILSLAMFQNDESIRSAYSEAESILLFHKQRKDGLEHGKPYKESKKDRQFLNKAIERIKAALTEGRGDHLPPLAI